MDRWSWQTKGTKTAEETKTSIANVRLYDGEDKTSFDKGSLAITTHRLIWNDGRQGIELPLKLITKVSSAEATFTKSAKVILTLSNREHSQDPGPVQSSKHDFIKLSFLKGGHNDARSLIVTLLSEKRWEKGVIAVQGKSSLMGGGLVHIERQIESTRAETDKSLTSAFKDIDALMDRGKDMVALAERITVKLSEKDSAGDETMELKSHLLSIGISNPVTRETHGTGTSYHKSLGIELARMISSPLQECGGVMSVSEVYCRYNRARGVALVSPEDVVNACKTLTPQQHGMELKRFSSGVLVVEGDNFNSIMSSLVDTITDNTCVTALTLSSLMTIPLLLAKERLQAAEQHGLLCRDETDEGIFFYKNLLVSA